jgi:hypothetical protein
VLDPFTPKDSSKVRRCLFPYRALTDHTVSVLEKRSLITDPGGHMALRSERHLGRISKTCEVERAACTISHENALRDFRVVTIVDLIRIIFLLAADPMVFEIPFFILC